MTSSKKNKKPANAMRFKRDVLQKWMDANRISVTQLADACEMPQASISRIINGRTNYRIESLLKICQVTGLSLSDLVPNNNQNQ